MRQSPQHQNRGHLWAEVCHLLCMLKCVSILRAQAGQTLSAFPAAPLPGPTDAPAHWTVTQGCGDVKGLDDLLKPNQVRPERTFDDIPAKEAAVLAEQIWRLRGGEHARLTVQEVRTACVQLG